MVHDRMHLIFTVQNRFMFGMLDTAMTTGTHDCDRRQKFLTYLETVRMQPEFSFSSETGNGTTLVRCFCAFKPLRRI